MKEDNKKEKIEEEYRKLMLQYKKIKYSKYL